MGSQSLARPVQKNISITITTAYNMADTEQKMVEEVPAVQEEEGHEPKVVEVAETTEEAAAAPEAPAGEESAEGPAESEATEGDAAESETVAEEATTEAPVEAEPSE